MSLPGTKFTQSVIYSPISNNQSNQQNKYSEQQIYKMVENTFEQFDKNKSGQLDSYQLKNFLEYAVKIGLLQQTKKSLFLQYIRKIDTNRDGLVSKQELFQYFFKKSQKRQNQPQIMLNSKPIDSQKIKKVPFPQKQYTDNQIIQLVNIAFKYDANGTGQLDYNQTKQYLQKQWNNAFNYHEIIQVSDKNSNGLINKDELYNFLRCKLP